MLRIVAMRRLMLGLFVLFAGIVLSATYWALIGSDTVLQREDNPRLVLDAASIRRGALYDRNDNLLAESRLVDGLLVRRYPQPAAYSAVGYYSFRYGTAGAEAAYDATLVGEAQDETFAQVFQQDWLHEPQQGSDVRTTLDLTIQQIAFDAMQQKRGAVVVLDVKTGEVLALLSNPGIDPNSLDEEWETLVENQEDAFFNRALQGGYQPGTSIQTLLMGAVLVNGDSIEQRMVGVADSFRLDDLTLNCVTEPDEQLTTLADAYRYACPGPFAGWLGETNTQRLDEVLANFRVQQQFGLPGFVIEAGLDNGQTSPATQTAAAATPSTTVVPPDPDTVAATDTSDALAVAAATPLPALTIDDGLAVGQGELRLTPLHMASIAAAIVNRGDASQPHALLSTRAPGSEWQPNAATVRTTPMLTSSVAEQLSQLMRRNVADGPSAAAARDGLTIGGHTGVGYAGEQTVNWFVGFVQDDASDDAIAIAVVVEDSESPTQATAIAGDVLARAAAVMWDTQTGDGQ